MWLSYPRPTEVSESALAKLESHDSGRAWLRYKFDTMLERYPGALGCVLTLVTACWVSLGGVLWFVLGKAGFKKTALGRPITLANCMWASWSCVAASSTHTRETSQAGRALAVTLTLGGLLSYSLLTGALTAQVRVRLESLRNSAETRSIPERGHVVIAGSNAHLLPLLKQLDRARAFARSDGRQLGGGRQTVVVLAEESGSRAALDATLRQTPLPELVVLTRTGSLSDAAAFARAGVARAQHVVLLSNSDDEYNADSQALMSMLAVEAAVSAGGATLHEQGRRGRGWW